MHETALVEVLRSGQVESRHFISFAITDASGTLVGAWGDPDLVAFLRSSAKPFQAIPLVESGAADHYKLDDRDLSLVCASHAGTDRHVELARELLKKIGASENTLQCGTHIPFDDDTYTSLLRGGKSINALRNNCSGKHAGMLGLAKFMQTDLETYLAPNHPVQMRILEVVADMAEMPVESIIVGVDGCSAPTFAIPLSAVARAYARLVEADHLGEQRSKACRRIVTAMTTYPECVAGPGRFDTLLMKTVDGRLVSKSGAEGFQSIGIPAGALREGSPALGIAIKVHDGDDKDHQAAALTAIELIDRLGGFREGERAKINRFDVRSRENLRNLSVGEIRLNPKFIGDFNIDHERL